MIEVKINNKDEFIQALSTNKIVWCNDNICYDTASDIRDNKAYTKYYKTVFMSYYCSMYVVDDIEKEWNDKDKFYYIVNEGDKKMKFRKKPVVIEAIQWKGDWTKEFADFIKMTKNRCFHYENKGALYIDTLEGTMKANINDWVIKGVNGEFYPCKPDIFEKTYEEVK